MQTIAATPARAAAVPLLWRRAAFAGLLAATSGILLWLMAATLAPGGFSPLDILVIVLFLITVPFNVVGLWNAVIGFCLMRFSRDPLAATCPAAAVDVAGDPVTARTAVLSCIRNEDVDTVFDRLAAMLDGFDHKGHAAAFDVYVLSDTDRPAIAAEEEAAFARLKARFGDRFHLVYRRRTDNAGFKAGNIRDFARRWGCAYDFALVLDADSYLATDSAVRLVKIMQRSPEIGILQSLVTGLPSDSAFARIFQFGMRLGMRSHTLGGAWWQGDCGPYWGHNALIRMAPFIGHCDMPRIPGNGPLSGDILSHDQVEAVLMRRAGYEVRVVPVEDDSFEENPPNLAEFVRRDLRWCAGNMQYLRLLGMSGLRPVSRVQLLLAILMFAGAAAWIAMVAVYTLTAVFPETLAIAFDPGAGLAVFVGVMLTIFAPKIATVLDLFMHWKGLRRFGGAARMGLAVAGEVIFFAILAPIVAVSVTMFIALLPFGRRLTWSAQQRSAGGLPLETAVRRFWPHTLAGLLMLAALWPVPLAVKLMALPLLAGLIGAIPFALLTAWPPFGRLLARLRLFAVPEEVEPPAAVLKIDLPALAIAGHRPVPAQGPAPGGLAAAADPAKS